jgi:hypothetical protein
VAGEAIALPVILIDGDIRAKIDSLVEDAGKLTIENAADAQRAAILLGEVHGIGKDIEKAREQAKAPFLQMGKKIDEAAKTETTKLQRAKDAVKVRLNTWDDHCRELARKEAERIAAEEAELARRAAAAEKARRDAEEAARKAAVEAEAARQAAEAADLPPPDEDEDPMGALADEIAAEEAAAERARIAEASAKLAAQRVAIVAPTKLAQTSFRVTLKHTVEDVQSLPSSLVIVTANEAEIRRLYCAGWKEGDPVPSVPGVRFTIDRQPIPTGRR